MTDNIKDVEIRQATAEDFLHFFPNGAPRTSYSWVAFYKGKPACIAGVTLEARAGCMAYSDVLPNIDAPKRIIWLTAKALMARIAALKMPMMMTACDVGSIRSAKFIMKLGFKYQRDFNGVELFAWQA